MVLRTFLFLLLMAKNLQTHASGFDAYSSCYRTSRKRQELPCDFGSQSWCTIPGNSYPWHAVRRFVHENQGLMRRMYGDERHISVLRAELESNDIELFDNPRIKEEFRRRYSKDIDGGAKEFVKILSNSERWKYPNGPNPEKPSKAEKIQKSIDEMSNNILYQNHFKNPKEDSKSSVLSEVENKTVHKTTTIPTSPTETTLGIFASESLSKYTTTTETPNSTMFSQTDPTVQPTTRVEGLQFNLTSNDTQYEDSIDYASETDEPPTTTTLDAFTTTEADFEEEEPQKDKSENYPDSSEETETMKQEEPKEPPPPPPPPAPMIRLKGINACPVKEEVVAPFWANNTRGEVLALLNLYPFEQYVHWEKCTYEHKQMFCREGCRCEQQYRLHRLLAYDPNNECRGIFSDWFRFPSCCVCKCYDLPMEFRLTSRSPRFRNFDIYGKGSLNLYKHEP